MKKVIITSVLIFIISAIIFGMVPCGKSKMPEDDMLSVYKTISAVNDALYEIAGIEMSHIEKTFTPMIIEYVDGSRIVYQQFYCSDLEKIKNGEVSAINAVFDLKTADKTEDVLVNGEPSLYCEKEGRAYLIWYPQEETILMIDFDPDTVDLADIIKMAESCE